MVLAGYDREKALLSDTGFEELQETALANLAKARHSKQPIFPLEGHVIDLPEGTELDAERLRATVPAAVERAAREMLEPALGEFQGIPALRRFAAEIAGWPEAAPDWQWCARFLYQVIERRGTGGGNFRAMYSRFLAETGYEESALAAAASERWTALAEGARQASERDEADPAQWRGARRARPPRCWRPRSGSGSPWRPEPGRALGQAGFEKRAKKPRALPTRRSKAKPAAAARRRMPLIPT